MNKPPILDTVKNSYCFLSDYKFYAVKIFLYLLPAFLVIYAINFWVALDIQPISGLPPVVMLPMLLKIIILPLLAIMVVSVPVYSAQTIAWHRAYLLGPDDKNRVNPLHMTREERQFMGKYVLYGVISFLAMMAAGMCAGICGALTNNRGVLVLALIPAFVIALSLILRFSFYFPAKATGGYLSFRDSFRISKGLGFRMLLTDIVSWLPIIIFDELYHLLVPVVQVSSLSQALGFSFFSPPVILSFFLQMPSGLFGGCMLLFVTVNNLSQYYRWIEENRMGALPAETAPPALPRGF